jgi:superfamily I DNA/RNA helicase
VQPGGTVSFFGDYHQQIYGQGLSWRACGLKVTTVDKFYDNLRNTAEISRVAISMSQLPHLTTTTTEDLIEPVEPAANGSQPILLKCKDPNTELAAIQEVAANQAAVGTVGIFARTWSEADKAVHGLANVRRLNEEAKADWDPTPGIYYGTYHAAKGLEFDVVILPFIDTHNLPNAEAVAAYGISDAATRDGKLLYVAVTRARAELLATYTTSPSTLLPRTPGLWNELVR